MQLLAHIPDTVRQACFNVHVHVFERGGPGEVATLDIHEDVLQAAHNGGALLVGQDAHVRQHARMGDGAGDVMLVQSPIEIHRGGVLLGEAVRGLFEAP